MSKGCGRNPDDGLIEILLGLGAAVDHDVLGDNGTGIYVARQTIGNKVIDTVSYNPIIPFTGSMSLTSIDTNPTGASYKNGVIALKGVQVVTVDLSWAWTRSGSPVDLVQKIDGVSLASILKTLQKTGLTIVYTDGVSSDPLVEDRRFVLEGYDTPEYKKVTADLSFGNRFYYVEGNQPDDLPGGGLDQAAVVSLLLGGTASSTIRTGAVGLTISPKSLVVTTHTYVAVPADMGNGVVFIDDASPLQTDPMRLLYSDVQMTNGYIGTELYDIYVSKNGGLRGAELRITGVS